MSKEQVRLPYCTILTSAMFSKAEQRASSWQKGGELGEARRQLTVTTWGIIVTPLTELTRGVS